MTELPPAFVDEPIANATASAPVAPTPVVSAPITPTAPAQRRRKSGSMGTALKLLAAAVAVAIGLGVFASSNNGSSGSGFSVGSSNRQYGYYHDRTYNSSSSYGPNYERDSGRTEQEWVYDGAYDYGSYGSRGMTDRAKGIRKDGSAATDPLYAPVDAEPDVFELYGQDMDPTGGDVIGDPTLVDINPNYNPYAGYSNPYLNRIRLRWGAGYGLGEAPREP